MTSKLVHNNKENNKTRKTSSNNCAESFAGRAQEIEIKVLDKEG